MPQTTVTETATALGVGFNVENLVTNGVGTKVDTALPAAKTGSLTTRTDNDTGVLTMDPGHGITTGAKVDVYWAGGSRRNMTVGTVATNSVPIDLGNGTNLPVVATAVTVMVRNVEVVVIDGPSVDFAGVYSDVASVVRFELDDGTLIVEKVLAAGQSWIWWSGSGETSPFAGVTIGQIVTTHSDSTAARKPTAVVLFS